MNATFQLINEVDALSLLNDLEAASPSPPPSKSGLSKGKGGKDSDDNIGAHVDASDLSRRSNASTNQGRGYGHEFHGPVPRGNLNAKTKYGPLNAATKRKVALAELYFLDYYYDLIMYVKQRQERLAQLNEGSSAQSQEFQTFCKQERAQLRERRTRVQFSSFSIAQQIGQGGYGAIFLATKKDTHQVYALKRMRKSDLRRMGEVSHILTERDILTKADSPWLVRLYYAFQDQTYLYLAMEYVPGGDFRTLLTKSGVLQLVHAQFYVAEMLIAINELHKLGFIHRDLKPENFLISTAGHIKLTDFGLSRGTLSPKLIQSLKLKLERVENTPLKKQTVPERLTIHKTIRRDDLRAFSLVGSPDYMAPEVLSNTGIGYGLEVDYWSIGCILFECLAGYPPFTAPTPEDVWVNVYHWHRVLERPVYSGVDAEFNIPDSAWDLITRLLCGCEERLSCLREAERHGFFESVVFGELGEGGESREARRVGGGGGAMTHSRAMRPPFVPKLAHALDVSYFDDFTDPKHLAHYKELMRRHDRLEREDDGRDDELGGGVGMGMRGDFDKQAPALRAYARVEGVKRGGGGWGDFFGRRHSRAVQEHARALEVGSDFHGFTYKPITRH